MKVIIKELGNPVGYPHCYTINANEIFANSERRYIGEKYVFILSCDSCPDAAYSSIVSFSLGIHSQLMRFLKEFGPSILIYNDKEFFIDVREKSQVVVDKEFKTFREAFSYCLMEDKEFWDEMLLEEGTKLADLH